MLTILLSTISAYGMQRSCNELEDHIQSLFNENLIDIFSHVFTYDEDQNHAPEKLKNNIEACMQLKMVCKRFDNLLNYEKIGQLCCKSYSQTKKNMMLKNLFLLEGIYKTYGGYSPNCLPGLIVICGR